MEPVLNWNGNIQITVAALDSYGLSATVSFNLNVNPVNDPVIINPIDDVTISEDGGETEISVSSIDVDGDSLYYSYSQNANLVYVDMIDNGIFGITSITEIGNLETLAYQHKVGRNEFEVIDNSLLKYLIFEKQDVH